MKINLLIVGVGFMGGSFSLALKEGGFEGNVYGLDINEEAIEKAIDMKVIEDGGTDYRIVKEVNPAFVVLASPVRTFRKIAERIRDLLSESCTVTDLGSVKGRLVYELENILGKRFVGGHPIAGTEKSGVEHSRADLFRNKKVIITPTDSTDRERMEKVKELWKLTGAVVEFMDPFLHDWVFGAVSHLPHAVAFALIDAIARMSDRVDLFKYPGAGFKDFSRIAGSDPVMWRDIFLENRDNLLRAIDVYTDSLMHLRKLIEEEKEEELTSYLRSARNRRLSLG